MFRSGDSQGEYNSFSFPASQGRRVLRGPFVYIPAGTDFLTSYHWHTDPSASLPTCKDPCDDMPPPPPDHPGSSPISWSVDGNLHIPLSV